MPFLTAFQFLPGFVQQKVFLLFIARIFLHTAFVLVSTLILSLFIAHYGAKMLPIFLLVQALIVFLGSLLIIPLIKKIAVQKMLLLWVLFASVFLFFSLFLHSFIFSWGVLAIVFSFFLWHASVFFALYIEQIFSPTEAEHAIPLIESGEPIGGILAGIVAVIGAFLFSPESLVWVVSIILLITAAILFFSSWVVNDVHLWHEEESESSPHKILSVPLLRKLFFATLFQAIVFVFLEYQYLLAAAELIPHHSAATLEWEVVQHLAHGLGFFHIAIFTILFIIQVFLASKIQHSLGVMRSLWIQPFFIALNSFLMLFSAFIPLGMIGKGIYETMGGLYKNGLASLFYAVRVPLREQSREFLEGIARPVGMLLGALLVIVLATSFHFLHIPNTIFLHVLGIFVVFLVVFWWYFLQTTPEDYTQLATNNLSLPYYPEEKFDALEILSQKGHEDAPVILVEVLNDPLESDEIKILALQSLAHHAAMAVFSDILLCLETQNSESLQFEALKTLYVYAKVHNGFISHPFSRQRIISLFQSLFKKTDSKRIRLEIIHILSILQYSEMVPFLLDGIHDANPSIAFCSILACGSFHDISVVSSLLPFLQSDNAYIKSAAITSLWQFSRYREILLDTIVDMMKSEDKNMVMSGIYTVGELKIISERKRLEYMQKIESNIHIQKHIAIALLKLGVPQVMSRVVNFLFHKDPEVSESTKKILHSPGSDFLLKSQMMGFIRQRVLEEIRKIAHDHGHQNFSELSPKILERLAWLYNFIGVQKMAMSLHHHLKK